MSKDISTVLFDLDGTILDTNQLVVASFQHTLKKHLNLDVDEKELKRYFGEPLTKTFQRYYSGNINELLHTFRQFDVANHDALTSFFPHAKEVIQLLSDKGIKLGIVTSKHNYMTSRCSHLDEISNFIHTIITFDDVTNPKPNPEPIEKALYALAESPEHALMVGDSVEDIISAKNAGVRSVFVSWSELKKEELVDQPDFVLDDFLDLLKIINSEKGTVRKARLS
ncbi:pyrophosphatase PpaX [Niallia sp. Sow4_A1]|uniref:Pyrophosphatase PpaX n=1 Tax=Niallia hominis TaxID=3133173 RepID=A0ABV1F2M4_9BACI|nr:MULTISPECIES: pyrophosphatase PpaX [Bacillaceae]MCM3364392.1 pyrophosphatase PpaX [Niallia sp. MER TA 168]